MCCNCLLILCTMFSYDKFCHLFTYFFYRQRKVLHQIFFRICKIKYGMKIKILFDELIFHGDWRVYRLMMPFIGALYVEPWAIPLQWREVTHQWTKWYSNTHIYYCEKMSMKERESFEPATFLKYWIAFIWALKLMLHKHITL